MKTLSYIFGILAVAGVLFVIGSAGALDCNNVSLLQGFLQMAAGMVVFVTCSMAAHACAGGDGR